MKPLKKINMTPTIQQVLTHIAATEPECIDRIRWEVDARTTTPNQYGSGHWPNRRRSLSIYARKGFCLLFNTAGERIARFRVKK